MSKYQLNYAAGRPQMYDKKSRIIRAERMIKLLGDYFGNRVLKDLTVLDVGSSTGIIDAYLAKRFKKVIGIDVDEKGINFAQKEYKRNNLIFKIGDAMKLTFAKESFDVVICTQVYEHVPNPNKMFNEIRRVLKKGGVCYFAALNRLWPIEPHYNLPFLSYLPKSLANIYIRLLGRGDNYYETAKTYWELRQLTKNFLKVDYTEHILKDPKNFGYEDALPTRGFIHLFLRFFAPIGKYFVPTFFWILIKKN